MCPVCLKRAQGGAPRSLLFHMHQAIFWRESGFLIFLTSFHGPHHQSTWKHVTVFAVVLVTAQGTVGIGWRGVLRAQDVRAVMLSEAYPPKIGL